MLFKTDKSKGMHHILKNQFPPQKPSDASYLLIEDGNALLYALKDPPRTFKDISLKLLGMISKNCDVIFSTDMYREDYVKSMERSRWGSSEKLIIKGPSTKRPRRWKAFLSNDENKQQVIQILLKVWKTNETSKPFVR